MVEVLKFRELVACQTVQIQIRLFLLKQFDQRFPCFLILQACVTSSTDNQHFTWEQNEKSFFKTLKHLQ